MKKIFKYEVPVLDDFKLELPNGFKILYCSNQASSLFIWVLIDPTLKTEFVEFKVYGTGHDIVNADNQDYVGTFINGLFVWHLFKVKN